MDVLAGRKTQGVIQGDLLINGHPKDQATWSSAWSRAVGYVEQTDHAHTAGLTVEESLRFSAGLRLAVEVGAEQREAYVMEVLAVTELLSIRGDMVGTPGETGLRVEQRRRLAIGMQVEASAISSPQPCAPSPTHPTGVELVANPSVVFMDEPTSGLDARSAAAVMAAVKNVAGNGRTCLVTIHQPSIEIFEAFDALVLLAMGGAPIYVGALGAQSCHLVAYFQARSGRGSACCECAAGSQLTCAHAAPLLACTPALPVTSFLHPTILSEHPRRAAAAGRVQPRDVDAGGVRRCCQDVRGLGAGRGLPRAVPRKHPRTERSCDCQQCCCGRRQGAPAADDGHALRDQPHAAGRGSVLGW